MTEKKKRQPYSCNSLVTYLESLEKHLLIIITDKKRFLVRIDSSLEYIELKQYV